MQHTTNSRCIEEFHNVGPLSISSMLSVILTIKKCKCDVKDQPGSILTSGRLWYCSENINKLHLQTFTLTQSSKICLKNLSFCGWRIAQNPATHKSSPSGFLCMPCMFTVSAKLKYGLAFAKSRHKPNACVPNKQSGNTWWTRLTWMWMVLVIISWFFFFIFNNG